MQRRESILVVVGAKEDTDAQSGCKMSWHRRKRTQGKVWAITGTEGRGHQEEGCEG